MASGKNKGQCCRGHVAFAVASALWLSEPRLRGRLRAPTSSPLYCDGPRPSCHLFQGYQLPVGPNPVLTVSAGLNTNQRQRGQAEWQDLSRSMRAPPNPCFHPASSQAPAASLKSSLYAALHLVPPSPVAGEPDGRLRGLCYPRRHGARRPRVEGKVAGGGEGTAFLSSCPAVGGGPSWAKAEVRGKGQGFCLGGAPLQRDLSVWDQGQGLVPEKHLDG